MENKLFSVFFAIAAFSAAAFLAAGGIWSDEPEEVSGRAGITSTINI